MNRKLGRDTISLKEHAEIYSLARRNFLVSLFFTLIVITYLSLHIIRRKMGISTDFVILSILSFGAVVLTFIHLGTLRFLKFSAKKNLEELAYLDKLTHVYNFRYLERRLEKEVSRVERFGMPLSLIYIDIDNFKKVNDNYGHHIGDKVLKAIASLIGSSVRENDSVGRLGGDEFLVIMPHTSTEGALVTAERLKRDMDEFSYDEGIHQPIDFLRLSMGVVSSPPLEPRGDLLLRAADEAMYRAKKKKGNRISLWKSDSK